MLNDLIALGLSRNEALVYATLVEVGPCFAASLVYRTKKHRQVIYNALESLEKKQLIAVTKKNGKNYYAIGEPERFLIEVKQKTVLAEQVGSTLRRRLKKGQERVDVFQGAESYQRGLADLRHHARAAREYIIIGGEPKAWFEHTRPFFPEHVAELRKLKNIGIDILILFYEQERASAVEYLLPYANDPYRIKIASDTHRLPHTTWLTGDHVYIITPTDDPLVVHIESRSLAKHFREYFWNVWPKATMLRGRGEK